MPNVALHWIGGSIHRPDYRDRRMREPRGFSAGSLATKFPARRNLRREEIRRYLLSLASANIRGRLCSEPKLF